MRKGKLIQLAEDSIPFHGIGNIVSCRIRGVEPFAFLLIITTMKNKLLIVCLCHLLLYPVVGYSTETLICSFRDSQNVYREFMLKRTGDKDETFKDANFVDGPLWKVMSEDDSKFILFREIQKPIEKERKSVYTLFFIDKKSGDFRFRNYLHAEYVNTIRGNCRLK